MGFAERLIARKPQTAAEIYTEWLEGLPDSEREPVVVALRDRGTWTHKELKPILEADEDNPAPVFGLTVFRDWRNENFR
jgi:hypothetical protein